MWGRLGSLNLRTSLTASVLVLTIFMVGCTSAEGASSPSSVTSNEYLVEPTSTLLSLGNCLEESGIEVKYDGRGGLQGLTNVDRFMDEFDRCAADSGFNAPFSEQELSELYALELENRDCLISAGFESDTPPSEQVYIDSRLNQEKFYESVGASFENGSFLEATSACPPPAWGFR